MNEEWKKEIAQNLDRELENRGASNADQAGWAYHKNLKMLFGWLKKMAEEVQRTSLNPSAVLVLEDREFLSITIGTEMLRFRARSYPFCARGWGKVSITSNRPIPFNDMVLWSKGDAFVWMIGKDDRVDSRYSGEEITRETIEGLFRQAFKKYLA
ncbi:MAG: hypothetical protein HPY50_06255 [Firmicutes bacterium]|nr:hypothetical protein [Bacillota bacterium]